MTNSFQLPVIGMRSSMLVAMMMLWCAVAFGEPQWVEVEPNHFLDVNSVKLITIDFTDFARGTIKTTHSDGSYNIFQWIINVHTGDYCAQVYDYYDANGKTTLHSVVNPRDSRYWCEPLKEPSKDFNEIIKRATQ